MARKGFPNAAHSGNSSCSVTPQGVVFIHYASPWPRMFYSQSPVWVLNV